MRCLAAVWLMDESLTPKLLTSKKMSCELLPRFLVYYNSLGMGLVFAQDLSYLSHGVAEDGHLPFLVIFVLDSTLSISLPQCFHSILFLCSTFLFSRPSVAIVPSLFRLGFHLLRDDDQIPGGSVEVWQDQINANVLPCACVKNPIQDVVLVAVAGRYLWRTNPSLGPT